LAERDAKGRDVWVFAYGSLLWNPDFPFVEKRIGTIRGYHRRFCLWQWRHRGTRARPNLMLALDRGGCCKGVLYRVAAPDVRSKLAGVWRRELIGDAYRPRWLWAETAEGPVESVAFVINRDGERYAGRLPEEKVAEFMAAACGHTGPGAEYLLETVTALEAAGLRDAMLWRMQSMVAERLIAATPRSGKPEPL
jgi:cation transport protein ChaC